MTLTWKWVIIALIAVAFTAWTQGRKYGYREGAKATQAIFRPIAAPAVRDR